MLHPNPDRSHQSQRPRFESQLPLFSLLPSKPIITLALFGCLFSFGTPANALETGQLDQKAALKFPRVFGDHMVLQSDMAIPIWGQAASGATVVVTLGGEKQIAQASESGEWTMQMKPRAASASPIKLTVESENSRIIFRDILIGEVWLCAGQSNMEWTLDASAGGQQDLKQADHPNLRLLHLVGGTRGSSGSYTSEHLQRLLPTKFCEGQWQIANQKTAAPFSAVAWYFGRLLQKELDVPVGLICPAVGGTPTEAWIPQNALLAKKDLSGLVSGNWLDNHRLGDFCRTRGKQNLAEALKVGLEIPGDEYGPNHSFKPGFMWESGIKPLVPLAIRGAIWYQGESNAETQERSDEHEKLFPLLVNQWRLHWQQGDFPFLYVQLPAIERQHWPRFREGQRRMLDRLANVGMAITIDTGDRGNVHPPTKKPVGERLARWALGATYQSRRYEVLTGPIFEKSVPTGDSILVSFRFVGDGLQSIDGKPIRHFELSGKDGEFHPAEAIIIGPTSILLTSPRVVKPVEARYAWQAFPDPPVNLFNSEKLPASPFWTGSEK